MDVSVYMDDRTSKPSRFDLGGIRDDHRRPVEFGFALGVCLYLCRVGDCMTDYPTRLGGAIERYGMPREKNTPEFNNLLDGARLLHRLLTEGPTQEMLDEAYDKTGLVEQELSERIFKAMLTKACEGL